MECEGTGVISIQSLMELHCVSNFRSFFNKIIEYPEMPRMLTSRGERSHNVLIPFKVYNAYFNRQFLDMGTLYFNPQSAMC